MLEPSQCSAHCSRARKTKSNHHWLLCTDRMLLFIYVCIYCIATAHSVGPGLHIVGCVACYRMIMKTCCPWGNLRQYLWQCWDIIGAVSRGLGDLGQTWASLGYAGAIVALSWGTWEIFGSTLGFDHKAWKAHTHTHMFDGFEITAAIKHRNVMHSWNASSHACVVKSLFNNAGEFQRSRDYDWPDKIQGQTPPAEHF